MIPGLGFWEVVVGAGVDDQQDGGQLVVDIDGSARADSAAEDPDTLDSYYSVHTLVGPGTVEPRAWAGLRAWPRWLQDLDFVARLAT